MPRHLGLPVFLISAASLAFEVNLTRIFSVAQFYHFAFMVVSIAMLGYGAAGTALAIFPALRGQDPTFRTGRLSLAAAGSMAGGYLLINHWAFDSFSVAIDPQQALRLLVHFVVLAAPFFCSGLVVGAVLAAWPRASGRTYAVNLAGSAAGSVLVPLALPALGAEGVVTLATAICAIGALIAFRPGGTDRPGRAGGLLARGLGTGFLILALLDLGSRLFGTGGFAVMRLHLSPYKAVSYALQYPGARAESQKWNAFSRVDVVSSEGMHYLPGLSYRYRGPLPLQDGLFIDGDNPSGLLRPGANTAFTDYLPASVAYHLREQASVLVLEPRGGLDVAAALALGANHVTAVEPNPLVIAAAAQRLADPRVSIVTDSGRSFLRRTEAVFDIIDYPLTASYHPVRSGAYSLGEDYAYTIESFVDSIGHLAPGGFVVATRWLQDPPSEDLRAFAVIAAAMERCGLDPADGLVAFRGYNTATIVGKNGAFKSDELQRVRKLVEERSWDMIYAPGLRAEESNVFNVMPSLAHYEVFRGLLTSPSRQTFFDQYPFDVRPPDDDRPFFGHFFKMSQVRQALLETGKTWQPFGGAGYLAILVVFAVAALCAFVLILLPVLLRGTPGANRRREGRWTHIAYFTLIGLSFWLVELPLVQGFILYLGNPTYAFTVVVFSLLTASSAGSLLSDRLSRRTALVVLILILLVAPGLHRAAITATLGYSLGVRVVVSGLLLAPVGLLLGIPFPGGLRHLDNTPDSEGPGRTQPPEGTLVPWCWGANGAASVVGAVLAALLALSYGFSWVLRVGALGYFAAWLMAIPSGPHRRFPLRGGAQN